MKKMFVFAILAAGTASVHAQNSVTLYGLIDQGVGFTNNGGGGKAWQMQSGWVLGSRWGLQGTENIGGGNAVIFTLESGFNGSNGSLGQGGREFGRQAFIGVQNKSIGTVTVGRQYDPVIDYLTAFTANGGTAGIVFAHPYDNDDTDDTFRVNNSIKFSSAKFGGLTFGGMYALSNQAGGFANNRLWGGGLDYAAASFSVGAVYEQIDNPGANQTGAVATNDTAFVAKSQKIWGAGANYYAGPVTLGAVYTHSSLDAPTASAYIGQFSVDPNTLKFDNFELNVKYQITPAFFIFGMYTYTLGHFKADGVDVKPKWHQGGLMADYFLSKRTDIYIQGAYQHVAGGQTGTALDDALILGSSGSSSTRTQAIVRVGFKHAF